MRDGWMACACLVVFLFGFVLGISLVGRSYREQIQSGFIQISDNSVYRTTRIEGSGP